MLNVTESSLFKRHRWKLGGVAVGLLVLIVVLSGRKKSDVTGITFVARRGPLQINILEGGSIEARESQEIRSEIKGYQGTKILSIVEEGYLVTEEDVKKGKVLVELDSSELKQKITTEDIQFQSTLATLTEAQQAYEIQINQNKSDVKAAEQKARFARMDLEKYLGAKVTQEVLAHFGLDPEGAVATNAPDKPVGFVPVEPLAFQVAAAINVSSDVASDVKTPLFNERRPAFEAEAAKPTNPEALLHSLEEGAAATVTMAPIDFTKYAKEELLGEGDAKQKLRKLSDDWLVAQNEQGLATTKLSGTKRLRQKEFVTKMELDNEELTVKKSDLKVETAKTERDLFIKYEFPKMAEELLSKYQESLQSLERARKEAISKLAQAKARLESAKGRFRIEESQRKELYDQLEKCVIHAKRPGLVVYGAGNDRRYYNSEEQIREGATVRERQPIITIPDMTEMAVRVKIHEAYIKKVKKGMKARIRIDAFPDEELMGEVSKVGVLPDSQDRWMNPDLKVYLTTIDIEGVHEWVKPGMSAKVEVLVKQLDDAIYVPIQAVTPSDGKYLCYVVHGRGVELREVSVGDFNDEFIEIKQGIKEGERVLLRGPEAAEPDVDEESKSNGDPAAPREPAKSAPNGLPAKPSPGGSNPAKPNPSGPPGAKPGPGNRAAVSSAEVMVGA